MVVATIMLDSHPVGLAYDSGKGEVFAARPDSNAVSNVSVATNTLIADVAVGSIPDGLGGLAYDSGMGEGFVANQGSCDVGVVSDSTNAVGARIAVVFVL